MSLSFSESDGVTSNSPPALAARPIVTPAAGRLWSLHGLTCTSMMRRVWADLVAKRLFDRAAALAFYFFFALFPALLSASSLLGLAAKSAVQIYDNLLHYLVLVIPAAALGAVVNTFNQTAAAATPGKVTLGLIFAIWSGSVGVSAMQDALNVVYKIKDSRSFLRARLYAIGLTIILISLITLSLSAMLGSNLAAGHLGRHLHIAILAAAASGLIRLIGWMVAAALLALCFAIIYHWAPDRKMCQWHWLTPGGVIAICAWLLGSLGLRIYLHFFNSYSITYGSLGAVIILLTWFYITGLMLLVGAECNVQLELAAQSEIGCD